MSHGSAGGSQESGHGSATTSVAGGSIGSLGRVGGRAISVASPIGGGGAAAACGAPSTRAPNRIVPATVNVRWFIVFLLGDWCVAR
ncbi:MAG: hypothetical protein GEV28_22825 [Actinophytocola sp.]|nr:hypothetical protein [Actinophytocola sp.]